MPDRKAPIALHRTFTPQEYERLKRGLVPQTMEDQWYGLWCAWMGSASRA